MTVFRAVRRSVSGVVVAVGLTVALPSIVVAERLRRGAGRRVARLAVRAVSRPCGVTFEIHGLEQLDHSKTYVFVPNHSSPIDIPAMVLVAPDARFLAAAELFRVPLLGSAMRALGATPIDRTHPAAARRELTALAGAAMPESLVVFAEGGIPRPGERPPFKSGAFVHAIRAGVAVVPVSIRGSGSVLPRGRRIWAQPGVITVQVHEPIDTTGMSFADRKTIRDRTERVVRGTVGTA